LDCSGCKRALDKKHAKLAVQHIKHAKTPARKQLQSMPWDLPCTADTLETLKQRITAPMRHYSNAQTGPLKTGALAESKESKQPGITTGVRSEDAGRCRKMLEALV